MSEFAVTALGNALPPTVPPSSITSIDDEVEDSWDLVPPEVVFLKQLDERARRAELLSALLQAKGIPPDQGLRAVQATLGAIAVSAEAAQLTGLVALARALQEAIGHVGMTPRTGEERTLDVLVFDETEVSRDLVALAVEAQGHIVRCSESYEELIRHLDKRLPDLIITEVELTNATAGQFCDALEELLVDRPVPVIYFSSAPKETLQELVRKRRPVAAVEKTAGMGALVRELQRVLHKL